MREGWLTAKYFAQDTKQTVVIYSQTPSYILISLFLSRISIERESHSHTQFSFMSFSGCLALSSSQSFTYRTHYLPLSHSPAAPTPYVTCMSPQTISLTIIHRKLKLLLLFLPTSPLILFALASAYVPLCSFLSHIICPFFSLPISLAQ